jgi:hypothetical protein
VLLAVPFAQAHKSLVDGDITRRRATGPLREEPAGLLVAHRTAKHYPCIKRAWVEFLGEPPGAGVDRVDPVPT